MQLFLTLYALFVLVIAIHEAGHYVAMRAYGKQVEQFSIGLGPTLLNFNAGGTRWVFKLFPVAGAVTAKFDELPAGKRIVTMLAGPMANILPIIFAAWLSLGIAKALNITGALVMAYWGLLLEFFKLLIWPVTSWLMDAPYPQLAPFGLGKLGGSHLDLFLVFSSLMVNVGLFNLLPVFPMDGGQIATTAAEPYLSKKAHAIVMQTSMLMFVWAIFVIIVGTIVT